MTDDQYWNLMKELDSLPTVAALQEFRKRVLREYPPSPSRMDVTSMAYNQELALEHISRSVK